MSLSVTKIVNLPQAALKFLVQDEIDDEPIKEYKTLGGVFSEGDYAWLSSGPRLEIIHTKTGNKVGAWTFGWVLKDSNTEVICVDEIQRPNGSLPLLVVGLDCDFNGGMICIFNFVTSKIIRAIQIKDKITNIHVIDAGYDIFTLPGPLRNFDGIIAVGTAGGNVFLVDICKQICDEALTTSGLSEIRDELSPCQLSYLTLRDIGRIEHHKELAVRNSQHLAIHLNVVFDKSTKHFTLKGPKGDDRIHVNRDEVTVSALYYCPQLGSLLVGYNFGALQLYNLMNLELVYTSPVCDEHIPISHFAVQEPADDPRAVCYVWAVYSTEDLYPTCLPLAVMYTFCYQSKEYHEGYGCLYQDFSCASVHYQMELGVPNGHNRVSKQRGGNCLKVTSINKGSVNKEGPHYDSNEDNFTLCVFLWNVLFSNAETETFLCVFDLNQWYKEQMPSVFNNQYPSTYMIQIYLNDLVNSATSRSLPVLDIHTIKNSIQQYTGAQRLEEHFYPNSITFQMTCLRENDVIFLQNYGVQKALLAQIESSGPMCLVEPAEIYQEIIGLGLLPLFIDLPVNTPVTTNQQREIILGTALENHLMGWLCKCASEWANGSFLSTGCSLDFLISWAFQRAITLKSNCDKFCTPLFDYSEVRLDNNTITLLNSCTRQMKNLYALYAFIVKKLITYISNQELVVEQYKSLETVSIYFEVLQWLLNVGLLPECPLTAYPRSDDLERICAPYPAEMLTDFYNHRRAILKILNEEKFSSSESVLFIDALIERECGGKILQEQWRSIGGNGLYPPPSLQALLRTYLIDNVDLSYKHSVIIYVFLDLAMTLDQDKYKPVITHLIKFPAVFKVSSSVIKLTQAFWQLDHSDYNTAMGLLLDPLISSEDLSQWHHKVALRALMLQKQHNFALLYVQVRKPILTDDDDILTAISLYVANNMLDEAFYFKNHVINQAQENAFLTHLFKECKMNDKLRSLIYRSLSSEDENFLLKYLANIKHSTSEDLQVYYHILRSHFMEAFESHDRTVPNQIENQGLLGQENAIPRDKLVYGLKKLLPDVNRQLLSLCQREKSNAWQQVSRPTPLSVFVHNLNENVQYKSAIIGAALAKAKQTFVETISNKVKMVTEGTPFLRTPTVTPSSKRSSAIIVNPKIVDVDAEEDNYSPPSAKRLKLSPRLNVSLSVSIPSKLNTPIVKRKTPKARDGTEDRNVTTPQSILKVKNLINHTLSKDDGQFEDDLKAFEKLEYCPVDSTPKKSGLGLSPRKSLVKSSHVRFEGLRSSSSSLNNTLSSSSPTEKQVESPTAKKFNNTQSFLDKIQGTSSSKLSVSPVVNSEVSSKNTSTEEEVFYSPETSLEEKEKEQAEVKEPEVSVINEIPEEKPKPSPVFSPRGRRSYKRLSGQSTPVRSSPRLSKNASLTQDSLIATVEIEHNEETISSTVNTPEQLEQNQQTLPPKNATLNDLLKDSTVNESKSEVLNSSPLLPKLRPRRSLCRKVLETNALNRVLTPPQDSPRSRRSRKLETPNVTNFEEITEKVTLKSNTKYEDGEESYQSDFIKTHSITASFVESDSDISADFKIDYAETEAPNLSESMLKFINNTRNSVLDDSGAKRIFESTPKKNTSGRFYSGTDDSEIQLDEDTQKIPQKESQVEHATSLIQETESSKHTTVDPSSVEEKPNKTIEHRTSTFNATSVTDQSKSFAYSVLESSAELFSLPYEASGPKLSESMMRCITEQELNETEKQEEGMEVDDEVEVVDNDKEERIYATLQTSNVNEIEKEETNKSSIYEKSSNNQVNEPNDGETSGNRPVDPEMNVFEITDDLSYNDGLIIEKEVTLEENDLCYGQQNTLEIVLEENIRTVGSTTPIDDELEKNVFNKNYVSEEESNEEAEEEEEQLEPLLPEDEHDDHQDKDPSDEVIEIGSSSEEENKTSNSSETQDSSEDNDQNLYVFHGKNIYDSYEESSESEYERPYSELSGNCDDVEYEQTKEECGLFEGDIVFFEDEDESEKRKTTKVDKNKKNPKNESGDEINQEPKKNEERKDEEVKVDVPTSKDVEVKTAETLSANKDSKEEETKIEHSTQLQSSLAEEKEANKVSLGGTNQDNSVDMDELNYSVSDEKPFADVEKRISDDEKFSEQETKDQEMHKENSNIIEADIVKSNFDLEKDSSQDAHPLNTVLATEVESEHLKSTRNRTRSASVSSSTSTKSKKSNRQRKDVEETKLVQEEKRTRPSDSLDKLSINSSKPETSVETMQVRNLRSRRLSIEEPTKEKSVSKTLRKRSYSVDEIKSKPTKVSPKKEPEVEIRTSRNRKSSSVLNLPSIPEDDTVTQKRPKSVLEGYSSNRRVTRQQLSLLKKMEKVNQDLTHMDPIVLLDKAPFEGKPDPEEQKVYDTSPSTTNSTSGTPVKATKRLRSASQTSETSQRSKSTTPVRSTKSRARKKSVEENEAAKKLFDTVEEVVPRVTRSRTRSVSSVNSESSNSPEKTMRGKRKKRVVSHSNLPEIQEETTKSEKNYTVLKKRTRKNSSQL